MAILEGWMGVFFFYCNRVWTTVRYRGTSLIKTAPPPRTALGA